MPTIDVSYNDLCKLIGRRIDISKLKDNDILYAKGEIEAVEGDTLKIDVKDTNRPDLWSAEGIAREIKGRYKKEMPVYKVKKSKIKVHVDPSVAKVRPVIVCAVAKKIKMNSDVLSQLIQLQEKVSGTFGRNRKEVAIGVYDLKKIKNPIRYRTIKPDGIKFIPLDFNKKLTPKQILEQHPKGKEFKHLLEGCKEYPLLIDAKEQVLSMPPIINSNHTGKVTEKTKEVFIEATGYDMKFLVTSINVICAALSDRGATIEYVENIYKNNKVRTPNMEPKKYKINIDYVNKVSGLNFSKKETMNLLEKSLYKTKSKGKNIDLLYPSYRQDIMHPRDIVEDVIISYGYNSIEPVIPKLYTRGSITKSENFFIRSQDIMIGLGMQEILSYTLTDKKNLFRKMNLKEEKIAEILNPVSSNWCVFRNSLIPGLLEFLSLNKHVEYPQKIFETGNIIMLDEKEDTKTKDVKMLSCAISNSTVSYDEISSVLDSFFRSLGLTFKLSESRHTSFIAGRAADISVNGVDVGIIGEINPSVLNNWKLEKPVVVFEIVLDSIF